MHPDRNIYNPSVTVLPQRPASLGEEGCGSQSQQKACWPWTWHLGGTQPTGQPRGETQARTAASQLPSQRSEPVYRHGALTLLMCQWDKTAVKGGRGSGSVKLKWATWWLVYRDSVIHKFMCLPEHTRVHPWKTLPLLLPEQARHCLPLGWGCLRVFFHLFYLASDGV